MHILNIFNYLVLKREIKVQTQFEILTDYLMRNEKLLLGLSSKDWLRELNFTLSNHQEVFMQKKSTAT